MLTDPVKKKVRSGFLRSLAEQIRSLQDRGIQCLVVTSGAIAAGLLALKLEKRPKRIEQLQALAAVGQSRLMHAYQVAFESSGLKVAQILLTREDLSNRQRYSNAHNTLMELFRHRIVPIVNENDTVAVEEIKFGNNDTLGVLVTHLTEADLLVLLTDTDGFFHEDPRLNPKAKLISDVHQIGPELAKKATFSGSSVGTGGMSSKIQAGKSMMQSGLPMLIANGNCKNVLQRIQKGEKIGTFFFPLSKKMKSRKRWLAWSGQPKGEIIIDDGAKRALVERDGSLLPTGIKGVVGDWEKGEIVRITDSAHREIAKGVSNYSAKDLVRIKGSKTGEIFERLGRKEPDEVVHRDNMVKSASIQ